MASYAAEFCKEWEILHVGEFYPHFKKLQTCILALST